MTRHRQQMIDRAIREIGHQCGLATLWLVPQAVCTSGPHPGWIVYNKIIEQFRLIEAIEQSFERLGFSQEEVIAAKGMS